MEVTTIPLDDLTANSTGLPVLFTMVHLNTEKKRFGMFFIRVRSEQHYICKFGLEWIFTRLAKTKNCGQCGPVVRKLSLRSRGRGGGVYFLLMG